MDEVVLSGSDVFYFIVIASKPNPQFSVIACNEKPACQIILVAVHPIDNPVYDLFFSTQSLRPSEKHRSQ
jgi:hypothetical protein